YGPLGLRIHPVPRLPGCPEHDPGHRPGLRPREPGRGPELRLTRPARALSMSKVIARQPAAPLPVAAVRPSRSFPSPTRVPLYRFTQNHSAVLGLCIAVVFVVIAVIAPFIAPYGADQQSLTERLKPPSAQHWFGTDDLGRDILSRVMLGAQISLRVGILA